MLSKVAGLTCFAVYLRQAGTDQKNDVDEEALEQHGDKQAGQRDAHVLNVEAKIDVCQEEKGALKRQLRRRRGDPGGVAHLAASELCFLMLFCMNRSQCR